MMETEDWRHLAHCRDEDPNRMQPEVASAAEVDAALALCGGCPVRGKCEQLAEGQRSIITDVSTAYGVHAGKWYGDPPRNPAASQCGWCGEDMAGERSTATYCGARCRKAAQRARDAIPA